jgi:hypothetical protein
VLIKAYIVLAACALGTYSTAAYTGWEYHPAPPGLIDPSVRNSPGGYRSYHFWHSGFHGGK